MVAVTGAAARRVAGPERAAVVYRTVWRWHFYAGVVALPFIIWMAITGSIYLFRPQVEAVLDRKYDHLGLGGPRASPSAQLAAALAVVPGGVLNAYQLPESPDAATQILVGRGPQLIRVYVNPVTLRVLGQIPDDDRLMRRIFHLHGELLMGDRGSMVVETVASWAVVMLLTGLFLWWPRNARGPAGVLYPRLSRGGRVVWRDLHAVTGMWVSGYALFLLLSGLPWAKSWGGMLKEVRGLGHHATTAQDWTTGRSSELAQRQAMNDQGAGDGAHAGHAHLAMSAAASTLDYGTLDRIVPVVAPLRITPPVLISPPSRMASRWAARSDAANRSLRSDLVLDGATGAVVGRTDFAQKPWLDRMIGYGISVHEGQLFGWPNRALGVLTAIGLLLMMVSAARLWWSRREAGTLGAPLAMAGWRPGALLIALMVAMAIVLPLWGLTVVLVLLLERLVLRRWAPAIRVLGLESAVARRPAPFTS